MVCDLSGATDNKVLCVAIQIGIGRIDMMSYDLKHIDQRFGHFAYKVLWSHLKFMFQNEQSTSANIKEKTRANRKRRSHSTGNSDITPVRTEEESEVAPGNMNASK